MSKTKTDIKQTQETDPDSMGPAGKIAAVFLLLLFAAYLILQGP